MATLASQIRSPFFQNPALSLTYKLSLSAFSITPASRHRAPPRLVVVLFAANLDTKPTILVSEKLGEPGINLLKQFANVDYTYNLSPKELCTKISLCDTLIVRSGTKVTREEFESSGRRLKVVGRASVDIDNVDLAAATEFVYLVVNAHTANTIAAAEHEIAHFRWPGC